MDSGQNDETYLGVKNGTFLYCTSHSSGFSWCLCTLVGGVTRVEKKTVRHESEAAFLFLSLSFTVNKQKAFGLRRPGGQNCSVFRGGGAVGLALLRIHHVFELSQPLYGVMFG